MINTQDVDSLIGTTAVDSDGDKLGKIEQIYLDDSTGQPAWATISTGLFGTKETFIPLDGASQQEDNLSFPYSKAQVKDAPRIDTDGHLSPAEEGELYSYYQLDNQSNKKDDAGYDRSASYDSDTNGTVSPVAAGGAKHAASSNTAGTGHVPGTLDNQAMDDDLRSDLKKDEDWQDAPKSGNQSAVLADGGAGTSGGFQDGDAMTRSEEQMQVGTESAEVGKARLRKYIVTENVTQTVPVSHEEVRIERTPITDTNRGDALDGPTLSEEEHEVTLHAEQPVVQKEAVPVERVQLGTETVTGEAQIDETLQKEVIETDQGRTNAWDAEGGSQQEAAPSGSVQRDAASRL